jgi:1,4-alpha-glucan branching enzyme
MESGKENTMVHLQDTRAPRKKPAYQTVRLIHFALKPNEVTVTGDFTGWARAGIPLIFKGYGIWETSLLLAPGEYQYRLLVDGRWQDHPEARKRVPNPFGSQNCVLDVPENGTGR